MCSPNYRLGLLPGTDSKGYNPSDDKTTSVTFKSRKARLLGNKNMGSSKKGYEIGNDGNAKFYLLTEYDMAKQEYGELFSP